MPINPIGPVPPSYGKGTNETPDQLWQEILRDKSLIITDIANGAYVSIDQVQCLATHLSELMNSPSATADQKQKAQNALIRIFGTDDLNSTTPFNNDQTNMPLITSLLPGPGSQIAITQASSLSWFMTAGSDDRQQAFSVCTRSWTQQNFDDTSIGWKNTLDQLGIK